MAEFTAEEDEVEIPIWVGGCEKWLTGLTRRTTCDDVIYALLAHNRNPNRGSDVDVQNYAVFESWRGIERQLSGRTKILKVWRTWGAETRTVKFCLRKFDNIFDSSSEISRTRRHRKLTRVRDKDAKDRNREKKSRERSRDSKHKNFSSKDKDCHRLKPDHKYSSKDHGHSDSRSKTSRARNKEKSKLFHNLVQLVIEQEKRIQEQLSKVQDLDAQIGKFESKLQQMESEKATGAEETAKDAENGLFPRVKAQDMEAYLRMCESILELEEKISFENEKISDLSSCIQEETTLDSCDDSLDAATAGEYSIATGQCTYSLPTGQQTKSANSLLADRIPNPAREADLLRNELHRCISLTMAQHKQIQLSGKTLGECEKQLRKKKECINRLFVQLDTIEEEAAEDVYNDSGNVDLPPYTVDAKDGRDSCDSGVQGDMVPDSDVIAHERKDRASQPKRGLTSLPSGTTVTDRKSDLRTDVGESTFAQLPRIRRHMVPYKTYTAPYQQQDPEQPSAVTSVKNAPSDDSDTGLSSLHSDEPLPILETLV